MKKIELILILLVSSLFLVSCSIDKITDIKNEEFVGKTVTISGKVDNSLKIGELSGFTLNDKTDRIAVKSDTLPAENSQAAVKGILMKDTLFGYYVLAEEVN